MDLRNLKSTDLKCNSDVKMPDPTNRDLERDMDNVTTIFTEETTKFIDDLKKQGLNPELANLTEQQRKGIKELCNMENAVLGKTDKSNKMIVMTREMYEKLMAKHIKDEEEITQKDLRTNERKNNGTYKSNMRIFGAGQNSHKGHQVTRITESLNSTYKTGAKMDITVKDHKPRDEDGNLKTRPLSNCIGSITENVAELPVILIDTMCKDTEGIMILSTEEAVYHFNQWNNNVGHASKCDYTIPEGIKYVMWASDVAGLYVAVQRHKVGIEVGNAIKKSDVDVHFDVQEAAKFIAVNMDRNEIVKRGMQKVIPRRMFTKGPRPSLLGREMNKAPSKPDKDNDNQNAPIEPQHKRRKIEEDIIIEEIIMVHDEQENSMEIGEATQMNIDSHQKAPQTFKDLYPERNMSQNRYTTQDLAHEMDATPDMNDDFTQQNEPNQENNQTCGDGNEQTENEKKKKIPEMKTSWDFSRCTKFLSPEEIRAILAMTIEVDIVKAIEHHCYMKGVKTYHQRQGGIIGLDLMRSTCRVYGLRNT